MDNDSFLLENTGRSIVFNDEENTKNESSTPNDLMIRAELFDAIWNCSEEDDNKEKCEGDIGYGNVPSDQLSNEATSGGFNPTKDARGMVCLGNGGKDRNNSIDCNNILERIKATCSDEIKQEMYSELFIDFVNNVNNIQVIIDKLPDEDALKIILKNENKLFSNFFILINNDLTVLIQLSHFINYYQNQLVVLSNNYIEVSTLSESKRKKFLDMINKIKNVSIQQYNDILDNQYFDIDAEIKVLDKEIAQFENNINPDMKEKLKAFDFDKLSSNIRISNSNEIIKKISEGKEVNSEKKDVKEYNNNHKGTSFLTSVKNDLFFKYNSETATLSISKNFFIMTVAAIVANLMRDIVVSPTNSVMDFVLLEIPVMLKIVVGCGFVYTAGNYIRNLFKKTE